MNKLAAGIVLVVLAITMLSSCKSSERCPAYGKANTVEAYQNK